MRILLLARSFNSLTQRLWVELERRGHELALEYDIADSVTEEAVELFAPDLVVAPFMKRAIPESVWRRVTCLVVHPGIVGDRGPSALDWAIVNGERAWGVTVLQAVAELDAGDIWATATFPMREARKASLYRNEVTEAATRAVLEAVERFAAGGCRPRPLSYADPDVRGRARPLMRQDDRRIDWSHDSTATVLRKMRAADTTPGVLDEMFGTAAYLYDAHAEDRLRGPRPGEVFARRDGAVLRATLDGAVWIGHAKRTEPEALKLPLMLAFPDEVSGLPEAPLAWDAPDDHATYREIRYEEEGAVGYLHFPFYNGAMSTAQCGRLLAMYRAALAPRRRRRAAARTAWCSSRRCRRESAGSRRRRPFRRGRPATSRARPARRTPAAHRVRRRGERRGRWPPAA
jgi:putative two-component system hydrogenase maturation factor HypX/HoxX